MKRAQASRGSPPRTPPARSPGCALARLHFEGATMAKVITAADEVLQRDPADLSAKSIRAVSGLRVATRSLEDIQQDQTLAGAAPAGRAQARDVAARDARRRRAGASGRGRRATAGAGSSQAQCANAVCAVPGQRDRLCPRPRQPQ